MKTHVTFATEAFEQETPQAHFINPCCFGEDCARWLADRLKERGFAVGKIFQEDWGWCFYVDKLWLGVGLVEDEKLWLIFCGSEEAQQQLCITIDEVLKATTHIRDIKWYTKESYLHGKDEGASSPK